MGDGVLENPLSTNPESTNAESTNPEQGGFVVIPTKQRGYIMSLLLLSLPVFAGALMVLTALIFCIRNHDRAQSYCFKQSLGAQENLKTALRDLLKLNPKAKKLRQKQKRLTRLYRKALSIGEPISISVLKARLLFLKKQRILLDTRQKQILTQSRQYVTKAYADFKKIKSFGAQQINKAHHRPYPLAVSAHPKGGLAPVYRPLSRFSANQALSFSWKIPLDYSLPMWLRKVFFEQKLSSYQCSATIKKHGLKWKVVLTSLHRKGAFL